MRKSTVVNLKNIKVMYVKALGCTKGAKGAFWQLETRLSEPKKRKYYGVLFGSPFVGEYRACAEILKGDNPESLGFKTWTIPGGRYLCKEVKGWLRNPKIIGETFSALAEEAIIEGYEIDYKRPTVEAYEGWKKLSCLLPIKRF